MASINLKTKEPLVVYLSRRKDKNGRQLFTNFAASYLKHPAGWPHKLVIVKKGFQNHESEWAEWAEALCETPFIEREVTDESYTFCDIIPREFPDRYILFLTAQSEIMTENWLELYMRHAAPNRLLGAHGLCGTMREGWHKLNNFTEMEISDIWKYPKKVILYIVNSMYWSLSKNNDTLPFTNPCPIFPNPTIRTNGFMIPPGLINLTEWPSQDELRIKKCTLIFEIGSTSLTIQSEQAGVEGYVVSSDGRLTPVHDSFKARTLYCHDQTQNMIISDNRTKDYENFSRKKKRWAEKSAHFTGKYISRNIPVPDRDRGSRCPVCGHKRTYHVFETKYLNHVLGISESRYFGCEACQSLHKEPSTPITAESKPCVTLKPNEEKKYLEWKIDLIKKHVPLGSKCLEVGAKNSSLAEKLIEAGYSCNCIVNEGISFDKPGISSIANDDYIEAINGLDEPQNCIIAWDILELMQEPIEFLRAAIKKMQPQGYFIVSLINLLSYDFLVMQKKWLCLNHPHNQTIMPFDVFTEIAGHFGLETITISHNNIYMKTLNKLSKESIIDENDIVNKSWGAKKIAKSFVPALHRIATLLQKKSSNSYTIVFRKSAD